MIAIKNLSHEILSEGAIRESIARAMDQTGRPYDHQGMTIEAPRKVRAYIEETVVPAQGFISGAQTFWGCELVSDDTLPPDQMEIRDKHGRVLAVIVNIGFPDQLPDAFSADQIEEAALAAHEANRILCQALGDYSQPRWSDAPDWQKQSAIKGVEMIARNPTTTPEQSHEGWLAVKAAEGWKYGAVKNVDAKEHPCFLPYVELPAPQRFKDEMFGMVVRLALGLHP